MRLFKGFKTSRLFDNTSAAFKNNGKRKHKGARTIALVLIVTILAGLAAIPAWAYSGNTEKQEVIYINLNNDGSVDAIYVVNIFDLDKDGRIIDYGDYTSLRNMTTDDKIQFENQTVKIDTKARKLYYEGKLNSNIIPWAFEIHYYMDGTEYPANEIAGKSGSLKITMSVRKNAECNSTFFEHYALQASFALDTNNCRNIVAEGATQANIGEKRQLTYTIMPGKEKNIVITADVTDFEMDGIAINGVPLSLDLDIDVENNEDLNELQDGVARLDDGANELNDGVEKLEGGSSDLVDSMKGLRDGAEELNDGANELKDGADTLKDGAESLNDGAGDLLDGADDLADGIQTLYDGAASVNDGSQTLYDGAEELDDGIGRLADGAEDLKSGASSLADGASSLYSGLGALTAKNSSIQAMSTTLYNNALGQYSATLAAGGYNVTADNTTDELKKMMERRQAELTDDSHREAATQDAIKARMATLSEIVANSNGSHTAEEIAAAQAGFDYWKMTLAIQGEQGYQTILAASGQAAADASEYYDSHVAYVNYLAYYGDEPALSAAYAALSAQVGVREQAAVSEIVTETLSSAVAGDDIYKALAVLSFYKGIIDYTNGVASAASGANSLYWGAENLYDGVGELCDGAEKLQDGSSNLLDGISKLMDGTAELKDGSIEVHDGALTLKDGVITLKGGTQDLLDGIIDLKDGTISLCDGTVTLKDGTVELLDGAIELYDGTVKLHDGIIELADGTFELRDKTSDANLKDKIKKAIDEALGTEFDPISFVSDRNTNVDFVQFVIKTPDISVPEEKYVEPASAAPMNFWQKLLNLLGLYHSE